MNREQHAEYIRATRHTDGSWKEQRTPAENATAERHIAELGRERLASKATRNDSTDAVVFRGEAKDFRAKPVTRDPFDLTPAQLRAVRERVRARVNELAPTREDSREPSLFERLVEAGQKPLR